MKRIIFRILIYLMFFSSLTAQEIVIKGKVTSAANGEAIVGASVYIPNTTIGTSSRANGTFELFTTTALPFQINISAIGFKTEVLEIKDTENLSINIVMKAYINVLDEVVITPNNNVWKDYGNDFIEAFIGYSDFAKQLEIANKEDITLYFDKTSKTLQASAKRPMILLNNALGYKITYWLEHFEMDYKAGGVLSFKGYPFFEDLANDNDITNKQRKKWIKNRKIAYKGSLLHFLRTVFTKNSNEEGFQVDEVSKVKLEDYYKREVATVDTVFYNNEKVEYIYNLLAKRTKPIIARGFLLRVNDWMNDDSQTENLKLNVKYQEKGELIAEMIELEKDKLNPEKIITIVYPIDPEIEKKAKNGYINVITLENIEPNKYLTLNRPKVGSNVLSIENAWQITYLNEVEEKAYQKRQLSFEKFKKNKQVSLISKPSAESKDIIIYKDGNYNPNSILTEGYWSYEKIDKMLPLDYIDDEN